MLMSLFFFKKKVICLLTYIMYRCFLNKTKQNSHLTFEGRRYVFSPLFFQRRLPRVNKCNWEALFLSSLCISMKKKVIIVGCKDLQRIFGCAHRTSLLFSFFSFFCQTQKRKAFPEIWTRQGCFLTKKKRRVLFVGDLTCQFIWHCAPIYWGEGDVWWGMSKGDALSMGWTRLLCFSILCIRVVHVI